MGVQQQLELKPPYDKAHITISELAKSCMKKMIVCASCVSFSGYCIVWCVGSDGQLVALVATSVVTFTEHWFQKIWCQLRKKNCENKKAVCE